MSSIIAKLTARPGTEANVEQILRDLVAETAKEPGSIVYDVLHPEGQPNVFVVSERYRDEAARAAHLGSAHLAKAVEAMKGCLEGELEAKMHTPVASIRHDVREFAGRQVQIACLPIGPVSLVYAQTAKGLLACGAIDPVALEKFGVAAARVKPQGASVASFEDLLAGTVREANATAQGLGITVGMTGREALERL